MSRRKGRTLWASLVAIWVAAVAAPNLARGSEETPAPAAGAAAGEPAPLREDEEEIPTPDRVWQEGIVVTATRSERAAEDLPFHTTVIGREEIERAVEFSAADLVSRRVPSLNLYNASGGLVSSPRDQSLNLRGVAGSNVSHGLLLVDGLPLLDPYNSSAIWSKVPPETIDRVEVVRGGGATVWGSLALSGVVNLITQPASERRVTGTLRVGERATRAAALTYSDLSGDWAGWIAASGFETDGFVRLLRPADRGAIDGPANRDYESASARLSHTLSPSASIQIGGLLYHERRTLGPPFDWAENDAGSISASYDLTRRGGGTLQLRGFLSREALEDFGGEPAEDRDSQEPSNWIFDLPTESLGVSAVLESATHPRRDWSAGVDLLRNRIERHEDIDWDGTAFTRRTVVRGEQQNAGGFFQLHHRPGARWSVDAGLRADLTRIRDGRSTLIDLEESVLTADDRLEDHEERTLNPSLGVVFAARPATRLRAAVYTGFRSPAPSELFVGSAPTGNRETVPNPELRPERLLGVEAGVDFAPSRRRSLRVTGYWNRVDDLVQRVELGRTGSEGAVIGPCGFVGPRGNCRQRRNLGESRALGVEVDFTSRPGERWEIDAGAAWIDAEITDNPVDRSLEGNRIENTPEWRLSAGVSFDDPRWLRATLRGRFVDERFDDPENLGRMRDYVVADLTLSRQLGRGVEVQVGVENLLDREAEVTLSSAGLVRGQPRLVHAGLRFRSGGER